jgi:hypothetical protein
VAVKSEKACPRRDTDPRAEYDSLLDKASQAGKDIALIHKKIKEVHSVVPSLNDSLNEIQRRCRDIGHVFNPEDPHAPPDEFHVEETGEWHTVEYYLNETEKEAYAQIRDLERQLFPLKEKMDELRRRIQTLLLDAFRNNISISRDVAQEVSLGLTASDTPAESAASHNPAFESEEPTKESSEETVVRFPTPEGAAWGQDIEMTFIDDEIIKIKVRDISRVYNFAELGFKNRRNGRPNRIWDVFRELADNGGWLSITRNSLPRGTSKSLNTALSSLRRLLNAFMGLEGDPFLPYRAGEGWQTHFKLGRGSERLTPSPLEESTDDAEMD